MAAYRAAGAFVSGFAPIVAIRREGGVLRVSRPPAIVAPPPEPTTEAERRRREVLAVQRPETKEFYGRPGSMPTERELEVFLACVELSKTDLVAARLGIAVQTVDNHLSSLYQRIGANGRAHAAALLYRVLRERYVLPGDDTRPTWLKVVA